jgi:hypothetical protein
MVKVKCVLRWVDCVADDLLETFWIRNVGKHEPVNCQQATLRDRHLCQISLFEVLEEEEAQRWSKMSNSWCMKGDGESKTTSHKQDRASDSLSTRNRFLRCGRNRLQCERHALPINYNSPPVERAPAKVPSEDALLLEDQKCNLTAKFS